MIFMSIFVFVLNKSEKRAVIWLAKVGQESHPKLDIYPEHCKSIIYAKIWITI